MKKIVHQEKKQSDLKIEKNTKNGQEAVKKNISYYREFDSFQKCYNENRERTIKRNNRHLHSLFIFNICQLNITARNDLNLEQKINLIKENEHGLSNQ